MLIAGAGGLAAQLFDDLIAMNATDIVFWSETKTKYPCIEENFKILQSDQEVIEHFRIVSRSFAVGIWDIDNRRRLTEKFKSLGGELASFITPFCYLSSYTTIGTGSIVLQKVSSEPGVSIGQNCIVNKRANFGHGCTVSSFCSIGPYAIVSADVEMGENCYVGMGAIILPKVKIGNNAIVSAGAVVTKNVAESAVVSGVPARVRFIKKL
jgi:sugar O-acyltransferase (sialic acid O-acetyltransferase NeuD family)